jgi:hypothetical protein
MALDVRTRDRTLGDSLFHGDGDCVEPVGRDAHSDVTRAGWPNDSEGTTFKGCGRVCIEPLLHVRAGGPEPLKNTRAVDFHPRPSVVSRDECSLRMRSSTASSASSAALPGEPVVTICQVLRGRGFSRMMLCSSTSSGWALSPPGSVEMSEVVTAGTFSHPCSYRLTVMGG